MKNKKVLIICSIVVIIASLAGIVYMLMSTDNKNESLIDGVELIKNDDVLKDIVLGDLKITDTSLIVDGGVSNFNALVSNETSNSVHINKLYVLLYVSDDVDKVLALNDVNVASNSSVYINVVSDKDLSTITKVEYSME